LQVNLLVTDTFRQKVSVLLEQKCLQWFAVVTSAVESACGIFYCLIISFIEIILYRTYLNHLWFASCHGCLLFGILSHILFLKKLC